MELHELDRRRHRLFLVTKFEDRVTADDFLGFDERAVNDTEFPFAMRTCAPAASGIRPPLSIMRPALISRSASLFIASRSSGVGGPEWADVMNDMKRMRKLLLSEMLRHRRGNCLAN